MLRRVTGFLEWGKKEMWEQRESQGGRNGGTKAWSKNVRRMTLDVLKSSLDNRMVMEEIYTWTLLNFDDLAWFR